MQYYIEANQNNILVTIRCTVYFINNLLCIKNITFKSTYKPARGDPGYLKKYSINLLIV